MVLRGVALVLTGSVAHAGWNLLVKRSGAAGPEFAWLYSVLVTPVLLLVLLATSAGTPHVWSHWWAGVVSAGLHTAYALVLQRGYTVGELGIAYPLARAGAPVLVAVATLLALHQDAAPTLVLGLVATSAGIALLLGTRPSSLRDARRGAVAGALTAVAVAAYTLWDGYAVRSIGVDVVAYLATGSLVQLLVLTVVVLPRRDRLPGVARTLLRAALPVAVLVPLSYGLVLGALHDLDVQVVAALRSSSIVAAAVLGWWALGEPLPARRTAGLLLTSVGVAAVAVGT